MKTKYISEETFINIGYGDVLLKIKKEDERFALTLAQP
jgi:hypothetical protein